jgi:hypothetical protein
VTSAELPPLVEQYRAGLDAALMLLHRLQAIAVDHRRASETGSTTEMQATLDHRDRVMATLVNRGADTHRYLTPPDAGASIDILLPLRR